MYNFLFRIKDTSYLNFFTANNYDSINEDIAP